MNDTLVRLVYLHASLRRLARYDSLGDVGMVEDIINGQWLEREDVLRIVDDAIRGKAGAE